jgi:DNA (cytosine-5)-methyltransferase 1
MSAGITAMRPKLCFFENVEGHITMGLPNVLEDLAGMGYRSTWGIFSAEECGAPHRRKRVFIMADSGSQGLEGYDQRDSSTITSIPIRADSRSGSQHDRWPARPMEEQYAWEPPRVLGNSDCWGQSLSINGRSCSEENCGGESDVEQAESRNLKSGMGGISHGDTARVDRLRLLGNGVVPATAELAFKTLYKELNP